MDFKYCKINPETVSKRELKEEIAMMTKDMWRYYNLQMALKILLNSTYGVIGAPYFIMYDKNIAEAIKIGRASCRERV